METIFRFIAGWLASFLERYADPELQSKLDAFNAKVAAAEAREKQAADEAKISEALYQTSLNRRNELNRLLSISDGVEKELENELAESKRRIAGIGAEAEVAKRSVDARSDADVLRDKL